jgi:hypothetical protein
MVNLSLGFSPLAPGAHPLAKPSFFQTRSLISLLLSGWSFQHFSSVPFLFLFFKIHLFPRSGHMEGWVRPQIAHGPGHIKARG